MSREFKDNLKAAIDSLLIIALSLKDFPGTSLCFNYPRSACEHGRVSDALLRSDSPAEGKVLETWPKLSLQLRLVWIIFCPYSFFMPSVK